MMIGISAIRSNLLRQYILFMLFIICQTVPYNYYSSNINKIQTKQKMNLSGLVGDELDLTLIDKYDLLDVDDHFACYKGDCHEIFKLRVVEGNQFDCYEDTSLVSFDVVTVNNETIKSFGHIKPYSAKNKLTKKKQISDICRLIKR